MRRTKIVCTVGPAIDSEDRLRQVVEAGADVFRLNFSHGTPDEHRNRVAMIRAVERDLGKPIAILQDLPGPKIRIGTFQAGPIHLSVGAHFILTTEEVNGDKRRVSVNYKRLAEEVNPGQHLLLADGIIELHIDAVEPPEIHCTVILGGPLSNQKGISVPRGALSISAFTDRDRELLLEGIDMGVSMAALSFVRSEEDVLQARRLLAEHQSDLPLMAKIEKPEAVDKLDELLQCVDSLMVARGDLGVEIPFQEVPLIQKDIIYKSLCAARPVITATQMLRSMVESPRPTRAEAADVANAVLDGSDAVMLSEESAMGAYPVEAVRALPLSQSRQNHACLNIGRLSISKIKSNSVYPRQSDTQPVFWPRMQGPEPLSAVPAPSIQPAWSRGIDRLYRSLASVREWKPFAEWRWCGASGRFYLMILNRLMV